ncbi:MAG: RNA polymerase sigma factor (sigma-70 family) [Myxococcota bacterium]|jgi:RNA polymerase sigma factor (sigma-70 family)
MTPPFDALRADHGPAIARLVASYLPPGPSRDDLSQDIWLAIWKALPRFRGDSSPRTYVFRIAHNRAATWVVRRPPPADATDTLALADTGPCPERQASAKQDVRRLMRAVRTLAVGQRRVLTLVLEGLSHREVGEILGVSENAVGVRLHRARRALRAALEGGHG